MRGFDQKNAARLKSPGDLIDEVQTVFKRAVFQNVKRADHGEGPISSGLQEFKSVAFGDLEPILPALPDGGRVGIHADRLLAPVTGELKPFSPAASDVEPCSYRRP